MESITFLEVVSYQKISYRMLVCNIFKSKFLRQIFGIKGRFLDFRGRHKQQKQQQKFVCSYMYDIGLFCAPIFKYFSIVLSEFSKIGIFNQFSKILDFEAAPPVDIECFQQLTN
eukprot:TRINITY_DN7053_c0_g2_i1.p2 TRINITY_DN7053_c0_g2~~TRINITY_DN7053_c0_g2_i1.p2  ORF type:complete len:114 (+),score=12.77 TRINITY_DN7053_c0_g2_i1:80-421(+)